jgi:hypothetical protein
VEIVGVEPMRPFPFGGVSCSERFQFCGEACEFGARRGLRGSGNVAFGAGLFDGGISAPGFLGSLA